MQDKPELHGQSRRVFELHGQQQKHAGVVELPVEEKKVGSGESLQAC
jgi:hypothetical protein